jgi:hypothetical protein
MSPEERERTIDFIIQSQARLAAAQEQDRLDRIQFEEWSKGELAELNSISNHLKTISNQQIQLLNRQTQILDYQSQRMDRLDKFYDDWLRKTDNFQNNMLDLQRQALRLLNLILDRLPPFPPSTN